MNGVATILAREYAAAMQDYLAGHGEAALRRAYETGRQALAEGLGVLEMVAAHRMSAIGALRSQPDEREKERVFEQAWSCFAESLSPFEMVLRGVHGANAGLQRSLNSLELEEQLRRQNAELMAAHRAVEKERGRYRALFDFAPDAYLVTGVEGAIREANTGAAALLNTPEALLPGQSLQEFVVKADRDAFRERLRRLHLTSIDRLEDWEVHIQPRNQPPIPAAVTVAAERTIPAVASLRWLIRNVTERKRLEKERARWLVGRAKAKAARRFEFLAEASALLAGSLDVEASLIGVARLAASFLGGWCFICVVEQDGSLRQLEAASADPCAADLTEKLRAHCLFGGQTADRDALLAGPQVLEPLSGDWCQGAADSLEHAALLRQLKGSGAVILPLRFHNQLIGVLTLIPAFGKHPFRTAERALGEDLARRCALALENARLYREVVAERDRAERASRAKDEFVAILGHELRNPLTPVAGWTQILKNHPLISQDPTLSEGVRAMEKSTLALNRLVGKCVDLARISEEKIQIERAIVDLNQIVTVSVDAVRQMAVERGLQLSADLAPDCVPVQGDAVRLEQVIVNLLTNAVKYTGSGGLISVRTMATADGTEVEVRDTGIGIDATLIGQIFEPFRQGTSSWLTSQSGLGLGLAIARRIVEIHGGRVWAESPGLGRGSTFRVRLPKAAPAQGESRADAVAEPPAAPAAGVRILLIEDSDDILFLTTLQLEKMGHTVTAVPNGRLALEAVTAHPPDLIISDIRMPIMDGYELIRAIRGLPEVSRTPAIALTGFGAKPEIDRALAAGFDACLSKPAEPRQIAALISRLTEKGHPVPAGAHTPAS